MSLSKLLTGAAFLVFLTIKIMLGVMRFTLATIEEQLLGDGRKEPSIIMIVAEVLVVALIAAFPVLLLWNFAVPDVFHLPEITYWQAWSLVSLLGILKSF